MMWPGFDGKPYTREEFAEHVTSLRWSAWKPKFIVLHNTAAPTLAQWAESGPAHDARIRNLEHYYEKTKGWHAGPHLFISRSYINGFSNMLRPGVHASCFNSVALGIEMVGNFDKEEFDSGDGALVRDNAIFAAAVLHNALRIRPDGYEYKVKGLHFHIDCKRDNHSCPGVKARHKPALVAAIMAQMATLKGAPMPAALADVVPLVPAMESPRTPMPPRRIVSVVATSFGGAGDPQRSAYSGRVAGKRLQVALPARLPADRRHVRVWLGSKHADCLVNDIGPWNTRDAYWETTEGRPLTESQYKRRTRAQNGRVPSNVAGIDMTPAVFEALGAKGAGKITVDWEFLP